MYPVAPGLSGAGPGAGKRGAGAGPEPGAPVYPGAGAVLDDPPASVAPGVAGGLRARRYSDHRGHRTAAGARAGGGTDHARLGAGHAGAGGRGPEEAELICSISLQRYLMRFLVKAPFPVREIGTVLTLLHVCHVP